MTSHQIRILHPWEELIGVVESVTNDSVTVSCTRKITVQIERQILNEHRNLLKKGVLIGVLKLDDGTCRVRRIERKQPPRIRGFGYSNDGELVR